nr:hypothetical protein [Tanacetum cinerariifolium]
MAFFCTMRFKTFILYMYSNEGNELGLLDLDLGKVNGGQLTVYQGDRWSHRVRTEFYAYMVRPIAHFGRSSVHTEGNLEIRATSFKRMYIVRLEITRV